MKIPKEVTVEEVDNKLQKLLDSLQATRGAMDLLRKIYTDPIR